MQCNCDDGREGCEYQVNEYEKFMHTHSTYMYIHTCTYNVHVYTYTHKRLYCTYIHTVFPGIKAPSNICRPRINAGVKQGHNTTKCTTCYSIHLLQSSEMCEEWPLITLDFLWLLAPLPILLDAMCSLLLINLNTCITMLRVVLNVLLLISASLE